MKQTKFVWLNLNTGEFSNSWTHEDVKYNDNWLEELVEDAKDPKINNGLWKLIEYTCHTDEDFEFYDMMKIK